MIVCPSYYRCGCRSNDKIWLRRLGQIREGIFPACLCLSGNIHLLSLAFSHIFENSKLTVITMYFFPTLAHQYSTIYDAKASKQRSFKQHGAMQNPYGPVASLAALTNASHTQSAKCIQSAWITSMMCLNATLSDNLCRPGWSQSLTSPAKAYQHTRAVGAVSITVDPSTHVWPTIQSLRATKKAKGTPELPAARGVHKPGGQTKSTFTILEANFHRITAQLSGAEEKHSHRERPSLKRNH